MYLKILSLLSLFLEVIVALMFFINMLNLKKGIIKSALILSFTMITTFLITYPLRNLALLKPVVMLLVLYITIRKISNNTKKEVIITIIAAIGISFITDIFVKYLYGIFTNFDYSNGYNISVERTISMLFGDIIYFTLSMGFTLFWNGLTKSIKRIFMLIFILLPASQIILLLGIYIYNSEHLDERLLQYGIICLLVSIAVDVLIYYTIKEYSKLSQREKYLEIEKLQKQMDLSYYQLASKSNDDLHKLKHDIRNQLQAAYALLAYDKDEIKAKGIIDNINYKLETVDNIYYCENPIINTIVTLKTAEAKNHNIKTSVNLKDIDQLIVDDIDLCSIFTNLYDNAISCCINNKSKENNFINIKTTNNGGYIIIKFLNWCDLDIKFNKKNTLSTTKSDSKNHGYGLKILKDIAIKYDGDLKLKREDNVFEAILLLKSKVNNF